MLDRLAHRGADGRRLVVDDCVAMGCHQFWTTPEEVGEEQPVASAGRMVAFDGRLDNRDDLLGALDRTDDHGRGLSDASLVLEAFFAWGHRAFDRMVGPFAIILWDATARTLYAVRDGLGDRTLFYNLDPRRLVVASEEFALLAHPELSCKLDESRVAHHFAIRVPSDGSTFFAEIKELRPGEVLIVTEAGQRSRRCWNPTPDRSIADLDDTECVERYSGLLTQAVRCRLRSTTPPSVVMSGGLDSTSIAAVGARELSERGLRMRTVSWIFDELKQCDERQFMDLVIARSDLEALRVRGDDAWPLATPHLLSENPSCPEQNPYRELKQRAFRRAAEGGSKVLLSGASADVLSCGSRPWFWDLLRTARLREAGASLAKDIRARGLTEALRRANFGAPLRPLRRRMSPRPLQWPWLTGHGRSCLESTNEAEWWRGVFPRPEQCSVVLGARDALGVCLEIFDGNGVGVEIRHPYRDRRLTEFMLQVPAHQLYRNGRTKHLARVAAESFLPAEIANRVEPTYLTPLFQLGVFEHERETVEDLLFAGDAIWPQYVDRNFVTQVMSCGPSRPIDEMVLWHCVGFESWVRRHGWSAAPRHERSGSVSLQESAA
jgi:asparagine synthase (glutamine-hydrolysing)